MGVDFLRPAVGDWSFSSTGGPGTPSCPTSLPSQFSARITNSSSASLGPGHVISWDNANVHLTEVTAAAEQELPDRPRLLHYKLRSEHTGRLLCAHGIHYEMSFQVEVLEPEIFLDVHDEILAQGSKCGLLQILPLAHPGSR